MNFHTNLQAVGKRYPYYAEYEVRTVLSLPSLALIVRNVGCRPCLDVCVIRGVKTKTVFLKVSNCSFSLLFVLVS